MNEPIENVSIVRNQYATSVLVHNVEYNICLKYQFIHRIYEHIDQILGGFDIGPSMLAYDGAKFYATELSLAFML